MKTFYSIMIAYDKQQCANHFHCIAEINCNNNSISQMIPMFLHVRNHFKQNITWFLLYYITKTLYSVMIVYDKDQCTNHALQKIIAITIVFQILYQCAILSEIALNITLRGCNCNTLSRHFISY